MADSDFSFALTNAVRDYRALMESRPPNELRFEDSLVQQFEFDVSVVNNNQAASNKLAETLGEQGMEELAAGAPDVTVHEGGVTGNPLLMTLVKGPDNLHLLELFENWNAVDIKQESGDRSHPTQLDESVALHELSVKALVDNVKAVRPQDAYVLQLAARMEAQPADPSQSPDEARAVSRRDISYPSQHLSAEEMTQIRLPERSAEAYELLKAKSPDGHPKIDYEWLTHNLDGDHVIAVAQKMGPDERAQLVAASGDYGNRFLSWYASNMPDELMSAALTRYDWKTLNVVARSSVTDNLPREMRNPFIAQLAKKGLGVDQAIEIGKRSPPGEVAGLIEANIRNHEVDAKSLFKLLAQEIPANKLGLLGSELYSESGSRAMLRQTVAAQSGKPALQAFDAAVAKYTVERNLLDELSTKAGSSWGITQVSEFKRSYYDGGDGVRVDKSTGLLAARLQRGDVITEVNGQQIDNPESFRDAMANLEGAKSISLRAFREQSRNEFVVVVSAPTH